MTMEAEAAATEAAAEDQSFEEAFAEFAGGEQPAEPNEPESQEAAQPEGEPETEPQQQEAAPTPEPEAVAPTNWEATAKDWEHRYRSEVGRQTALQRKVQELEAQLQKQPQSQQAQRQYSDRMQALMSDFPEIAQALQEELETQLAAVRTEVQQAVAPLKQQEQQRSYEQEESKVLEKYPDFKQTVNQPDFLNWFQSQPDAVRALAASPLASDTLAVMDYYSAARRSTQPAANPEVQAIQEKRQQSMQRNVSVRSSAPPPVADGPDDFEAAFAHYARQRERK